MVCTPGRGRMAAMDRLLATGRFPEMSAEEASYEKLAAKAIHKEIHEADEANLLEEEDMHVFDCKPLTDPLHLVCCNACKKPIRASQYAAHAERCRLLNSTDDTGLELDGGSGHKKPPRKGRKKVQTAHDNQAATVGEQERSESLDGDDTAASESANMDDNQTGMTSSLSRDIKRTSTSIDGGVTSDGSGVSPGSANYPAGAMSSSKRIKLMPIESMLIADGLETARGVTTETKIRSQGILTYAPVPLATKMYHLKRNHRFRTTLGHLFREAVAMEHGNDSLSPKILKGNTMISSQVSSSNDSLNEAQKEGMTPKKKDPYGLPAVCNPDHRLAQSSEMCLGLSGGYPSVMSFSNQFRDNNFARPPLSVDSAPMGMMRNKYLSTTYSFSVNPGTKIGTMQQPNGIVPVI